MTVITFQPRMAPLVVSGAKPHTIRRERKRPIRVGDSLSLRQWSGAAYRSPQIILREVVCTRVDDIRISYSDCWRPIHLNGALLTTLAAADLARADGFHALIEFCAFFSDAYGLPFTGVLICWGTA